MTKRLASKHKVDRRLKVNLWGRPKSPFNSRNYPQDNMESQQKSVRRQIMALNWKQNKN